MCLSETTVVQMRTNFVARFKNLLNWPEHKSLNLGLVILIIIYLRIYIVSFTYCFVVVYLSPGQHLKTQVWLAATAVEKQKPKKTVSTFILRLNGKLKNQVRTMKKNTLYFKQKNIHVLLRKRINRLFFITPAGGP